MFAQRSREVEFVSRILLIAVLLFGSLGNSRAVLAAPPRQESTPKQGVPETPTAGPTIPPAETTTPSVTETPTPLTTALPTETTTSLITSTATSTVTPVTTATPAPTNTPEGKPAAQGPELILASNPNFITPGGNLVLTWEVQGGEPDGLILQINLPEGVAPYGNFEGTYDEISRLLLIRLSSLNGQVQLTTTITKKDVLFEAMLLRNGETLTSVSLFVPAHEQFVMDEKGGEIVTSDGKLRVHFPKDALKEKVIVEIGAPAGDAVPSYLLLGYPFEIKAHSVKNGAEIKHFDKELTIDIPYANLGIPETDQPNLKLNWFNPETQQWEQLPSWVETSNQMLHAYTDHFTVFDLNVNYWQASNVPTVDTFQVSNFTGAGTYSLPIEVPAGPGGLQPSVVLNYNSQVVDQSSLNTQASWVGMGWSLDTGSIEMDTHGTDTFMGDDTYLLNVAGISTQIISDGSSYRTADENFWKITYANNAWILQDKQGNIYTFSEALPYPYLSGCRTQWAYYRWMLKSIQNIFGQQITYNYTYQSKSIRTYSAVSCVAKTEPATTAVYPSTITYAGGKYRVRFALTGRGDYISSWDADLPFHTYEKYRLGNIYVEQDLDGNGAFETVIRRYDLAYKADSDSDIIFSGYLWANTATNRKTSTLASVKEYGVNGTSSLPATTFTYGDNLHLTHVNNGYGGAVDITYDTNPWFYEPYAAEYHRNFSVWGYNRNTSCNSPNPWKVRAPGHIECEDNSGVPNWLLLSGVGYDPEYSVYGLIDYVRPGGVYKLSAFYWLEAATSLQLGLSDGNSDNYSSLSTTASVFKLPVTATQVVPLVNVAGSGWAHLVGIRFELLTSVYRVKQKSITDGNGHTYTSSFTYSGAAVNDASNSSGICGFTADDWGKITDATNCHEYFRRFSEFRGHSSVTETRPDGTKTITTFSQLDDLKGRPTSVIASDSVHDLTRTFYSYTTQALPVGYYAFAEDGCYTTPCPYIGITHYWVDISSVVNEVYAIDGTKEGATKTLYGYDAYGNLTAQTEQLWNGTTGTAYRKTTIDYFYDTTKYLVGFPARQQIRNGSDITIAETLNIYDSNSVYYSAPTQGKLAAVRTWTSGTSYSQLTYGYDSYGNRTTVTTYTGYSTRDSSPNGNSASTYTCYGGGGTLDGVSCPDDGYHVYPLWTRNARGQQTSWTYDYASGVPLSESDANDSPTNDTTINAEYDTFGRMLKLIRPGDDSTSPTIQISYNDTDPNFVGPFITTISQKIDGTQGYYAVQRVYDGMGRQIQINRGGTIVDTKYESANITRQSVPYQGTSPDLFTTTIIDPAAHTTTVTTPDGTSTTTHKDGLISTFIDAGGNSTISTSDIWGRVVSVTPPTGPGLSYIYDEFDHLVKATRGATPPPEANHNPGTDYLVSWWSMNETSGTRYDSQSANHLADHNGVAATTGKQGNAAQIVSASSKYVSMNDNDSLSMGPGARVTVGAWVNLASLSSNSENIIAKRSYNSGNYEYFLRYEGFGNPKRFAFYVSQNGSNLFYVLSNSTVTANTWIFVAAGYDGSNLWISIDNGPRVTTPYTLDIYNGTSPLAIGAALDPLLNTPQFELWDGYIDEAFVYKRALSESEVNWVYNNGSGRSFTDFATSPGTVSLASWWTLDEAGGTRYDSYGNNNLTDNNTVGSTQGKQGNAGQFVAASHESLSIGDNASLSMNNTNFTIATWVKLNSKSNHGDLVIKWVDGSSQEYALVYNYVLDRFLFYAVNGGSGAAVTANNFGSPTAGTWNYVVAWYDGNSINISVNNLPPDSVSYTGGVADGNQEFRLGDRGTNQFSLDGSLDEVAIYKRALSSAERTWLYNNGTGRSYAEINPPPTPGQSVTTITYDKAGRKIFMSDADMGNWQYGYDALGNLTSQTDARGCVLVLGYDALSRLTSRTSYGSGCSTQVSITYTYDAGLNGTGQRTGMSDASGSTTWAYDTRGRPISESKNIIGAGTFKTSWGYNSADLMTSMTYPGGNDGSAGETVTYDYNEDMLLKSLKNGTDSYVSNTNYDPAGRVTSRTLGNSLIQTFSYYDWIEKINNVGQGGRLKNLTVGSLQNLSYAYDSAGNVASITDGRAGNLETQTFTYDNLDRLTSAGVDGLYGYNESYQYNDITGNLETKGGLTFSYEDVAHRHAVTRATSGAGTDSFIYDANGNMISRSAGGQTLHLAYDAENRLTSADAATPTPGNCQANLIANGDFELGNTRFSSSYSYTPDDLMAAATYDMATDPHNSHPYATSFGDHTSGSSRMMAVNGSGTAGTIVWSQNVTVSTNTSYEFSAWLASWYATAPAQLQVWINGNPVSSVTASSTTGLWQQFSITWNSGASTSAAIQIINLNTASGGNDFALDDLVLRSLQSCVTPAPSGITFVYDGDGNRVSQTINGVTTYFIGGHYEVTGSTVTKYYFVGSQRVAMSTYTIPQNPSIYYLLSDHLGSTSITTDTNGVSLSELRYKAWGEVRYTSGMQPTRYQYTGQYTYLDELGLIYYKARFYSPYITQFSQPDSIVPDPYNPQDLNRYAYARYNPLRYTDPSGHRVCEEKAGVCKAYTQADQISDLKLIIKDQFKWFVKGKDWTVKELETIYQTGTDIMTYIDKETGGYGLDWMNKYLGGVNIYHVDANRDSALPGIGSTRINLFRGWLTQDGGARWFAHELGHVWDLNTGLLGYGGEADQLNAKINGNKLLGLFSCRFCDGSGLDHIPAGYAWAPGAYGNNSTADYFAEAFALMVYTSSGPQIPVGVQDWMNGQISAETAWSNFP